MTPAVSRLGGKPGKTGTGAGRTLIGGRVIGVGVWVRVAVGDCGGGLAVLGGAEGGLTVLGAVGVWTTVEEGGRGNGVTGGFVLVGGGGGGDTVVVGRGVIGTTALVGLTDS